MKKPTYLEEKHLIYLDRLRQSGVTNMFGAGEYLVNTFNLKNLEAREILLYWMETFETRHPE